MNKFTKRALLIAFISAVFVYFVDYAVWTYLTQSDMLDAGIVAVVVFLIAFFGMKFGKK